MNTKELKGKLIPIKALTDQEKLEQLIEDSRVILEDAPPKPDVLLSMGGTEMFTCGDISAVVSRAGHGKSTLLSLICGEMINTRDDFFESELKDEKPIVYFDTEMSDYDVWRITHRLSKITGLEGEALQKRFQVFKTEHIGDAGRKDFILEVIKRYEPQFAIIDGVTDLVSTINDEAIAKETISEFRAIANGLKCHILAVIHSNEGKMSGDEARGWIGKEWKRKAEGEINVKFDNKEFKVSCGKGRHGRFEDWTFELDMTTKAPYFTGKREKSEAEQGREESNNYLVDAHSRNELSAELSVRSDVISLCANGGTQKGLQSILATRPGIGISKAQKLAKLIVEDGTYFYKERGKVFIKDQDQSDIFGAIGVNEHGEPDLPF